LEAKPVVRGEGNDGITELQKRLERKADVDTVEQLLRGSTKTKEGLEALAKAIDELKRGIRRSSRTSVKMDEPILPTGGDLVSEPTDAGLLDARCKKVEDQLQILDKKLSAKADRSSIDDLQFKIASTGGAGGKEDQSKSDSSGMKDLIAKKADRNEMLELLKTSSATQVESLDKLYKELKERLNILGSSVTALVSFTNTAWVPSHPHWTHLMLIHDVVHP